MPERFDEGCSRVQKTTPRGLKKGVHEKCIIMIEGFERFDEGCSRVTENKPKRFDEGCSRVRKAGIPGFREV